MKDSKYYEDLAKNINHEALIKNFVGKQLTTEEKENIKKSRELEEAVRKTGL